MPTLTPQNRPGSPREFVQLVLKCVTKSPVEECEGHLVAVYKWEDFDWQPTEMNESLHLAWSYSEDSKTITLHPGGEKRLNICFLQGTQIVPCTSPLPLRAASALKVEPGQTEVFRFDVMLTSTNCRSVSVSVGIQNGGVKDGPEMLSPIAKILNLSDSTPW
jgi:hypothetical protein